MLADGVERWKEKDVAAVAEALDGAAAGHGRGADRDRARSSATRPGPGAGQLVKAVEKCGGEVTTVRGAEAAQVRRMVAEQGAELGLA